MTTSLIGMPFFVDFMKGTAYRETPKALHEMRSPVVHASAEPAQHAAEREIKSLLQSDWAVNPDTNKPTRKFSLH